MKAFLPPKTLLSAAIAGFLLIPLAASAGHTNMVLTAQLDGRQEVPANGNNRPVIAALAGPGDGNAADCLTEGEMGKFPLHPEAGSGIVQDILSHPEDYYINVHNPDFPSGAVRGQLEHVDNDE